MNIINKKLSLSDFKAYISSFNFAPLNPTKIVLHHTWRPTVDQWQGQKSINGLKTFYEGKGWSAGPHLFIGPDGVWLFTPMNQTGIHASEGNYKSIGIEIVGDYDNGVWQGEIKKNVVGVVKTLMEKLHIGDDMIKFHRDYSTKTCPGKAITKEWVLSLLHESLEDPVKRKELEDDLANKMYAVSEALMKANVAREKLALFKGVPVRKYTIKDE